MTPIWRCLPPPRVLRPLLGELVFLGGCTTGLMISDPAAGGVRPTKDVDAITEVA